MKEKTKISTFHKHQILENDIKKKKNAEIAKTHKNKVKNNLLFDEIL
jgi:hypothetical protein